MNREGDMKKLGVSLLTAMAVIGSGVGPAVANPVDYVTSCADTYYLQRGCTPVVAVGGQAVGAGSLGSAAVSACQTEAHIRIDSATTTIFPLPGVSGTLTGFGNSLCGNTAVTKVVYIGVQLYSVVGTTHTLVTSNFCTNTAPSSSLRDCAFLSPEAFSPGQTLLLHTYHAWDVLNGAAWVARSIDGCSTLSAVRVRCSADAWLLT